MSGTNRKLNPKDDPANDPAMAAFRPANRLQSLMAEIRSDNPIAKPDRPHPPSPDLRSATSLDTQREELQRALTTESEENPTPVPDKLEKSVNLAPTLPPLVIEPVLTRTEMNEPEKLTAPGSEQNRVIEVPKPALENFEQPVNDAAVHTVREEPAPRLRGRPRVSEEKKRESSYTLSPHIAGRIRDLAALEQYRLKRTVSASEILEALVIRADEQIRDNIVLTR